MKVGIVPGIVHDEFVRLMRGTIAGNGKLSEPRKTGSEALPLQAFRVQLLGLIIPY